MKGVLLPFRLLRLHRAFHSRLALDFRVPTVLLRFSAGIYTCCPSTTPFGLALGPDFPRADQLYPGYLGYSAIRILTLFSLLTPSGTASVIPQCSPTNHLSMIPELRCRVSAPVIFGAGPLG